MVFFLNVSGNRQAGRYAGRRQKDEETEKRWAAGRNTRGGRRSGIAHELLDRHPLGHQALPAPLQLGAQKRWAGPSCAAWV